MCVSPSCGARSPLLAVIVANSVSIDELPGVDGSTEGCLAALAAPSCLFLPTHQQKHREEVITEEEEEEEENKGEEGL